MKKIYLVLSTALLVMILFACNQQTAPSASSSTALEKTNWKLIHLSSISGALPEAGKAVTMRLDSNRVTGNAGCNRYFGTYTLNASKLQFTGVGSTKMYCEGKMEVENGVMQALNSTNAYHIAGNTLSLLKDSDTLARFEPGAAQ